MPNDSAASAEIRLARLSKGGAFVRLAGISVVVLAVAGAFLYLGGWFSPNALTPKRFADRFERVDGTYSGFRLNHAKASKRSASSRI
jgi:catalase